MFFFSSRRRHTICALVTGVQTCALPIFVFRKTARNFNPDMATAANATIAEVEEVVPAGELDPDHIHTPGIFVDRVIRSSISEWRVETPPTRRRGLEVCRVDGPAQIWLRVPRAGGGHAPTPLPAFEFPHWWQTTTHQE